MTRLRLNGDLPRLDEDPVIEIPPRANPAAERGATALRAELATVHAQYRRAMHEAQHATEPAARKSAFAEARRLIGLASRLQARLRGA